MEKNKEKLIKITIVIAFLIIIDQALKVFIPKLIQNGSIDLIKGFLNLTYAENTGGAFSFGQNNLISIVIMNVVIIGIVIRFLMSQIERIDTLTNITICFILAGGISNLVDRVFRGYVIDYIDISPLFKFAIFNLADIFVILGWIALVILTIRYTSKKTKENK